MYVAEEKTLYFMGDPHEVHEIIRTEVRIEPIDVFLLTIQIGSYILDLLTEALDKAPCVRRPRSLESDMERGLESDMDPAPVLLLDHSGKATGQDIMQCLLRPVSVLGSSGSDLINTDWIHRCQAGSPRNGLGHQGTGLGYQDTGSERRRVTGAIRLFGSCREQREPGPRS